MPHHIDTLEFHQDKGCARYNVHEGILAIRMRVRCYLSHAYEKGRILMVFQSMDPILEVHSMVKTLSSPQLTRDQSYFPFNSLNLSLLIFIIFSTQDILIMLSFYFIQNRQNMTSSISLSNSYFDFISRELLAYYVIAYHKNQIVLGFLFSLSQLAILLAIFISFLFPFGSEA